LQYEWRYKKYIEGLAEKPEWKTAIGRPLRKREESVKIDIKESGRA
jgi:hypothetical protein